MTDPKLTLAPATEKKRLHWIDAAKGIAILLVLIAHSEFWTFYNSVPKCVPLSIFGSLITLCSASFMPLFYFLSGYTYKKHERELQYRSSRLLIPYILWGLLYLFISWYGSYSTDSSLLSYLTPVLGLAYARYSPYIAEYGQLPTGIFPTGAEPLWFLPSLFMSYIFFYLLLKTKELRIATIILYVIFTFLLSFTPILLPWSLDTAFAGALFIYTGFLARKTNITQLPFHKRLLIFFAMIPLYTIVFSINGGVNFSIGEYGKHALISPILFLLIGILGSFLYCLGCQLLEGTKIIKLLAYIGRTSLTLLCSHMICFLSILAFSNHIHSMQHVVLLQIFTAILLAITIHELRKRISIQQLKTLLRTL